MTACDGVPRPRARRRRASSMPKPPGARAVNTSSQVGESNNRGEKPRHVAATMAPSPELFLGRDTEVFAINCKKPGGRTGSLWVHESQGDDYQVYLPTDAGPHSHCGGCLTRSLRGTTPIEPSVPCVFARSL